MRSRFRIIVKALVLMSALSAAFFVGWTSKEHLGKEQATNEYLGKEQASNKPDLALDKVSVNDAPMESIRHETLEVQPGVITITVARPHSDIVLQTMLRELGEPKSESPGHSYLWSNEESTVTYEGFCNLESNSFGRVTIYSARK